jgi:pimeloyl-ACP methyl ester carboxylesterase
MIRAAYTIAAVAAIACASAGTQTSNAPARVSIVEDSAVLVTPDTKIFGTLELPPGRNPVPVVLIIAGSGPTDRNGNSRVLPGANNSLKLLASGLAERGIASLRYDKRGIGESVIADMKEENLRFTNYVDDAAAWIRQLRADKRFSTITVAGHSEGSLIGMIAAAQAGADGFISLEGAGRNAKDVIIEQLSSQLQPSVVETSRTIMERIEKGEKVDSIPVFLNALFRPSVQPYLASWFRYTPSVEIGKLKVPVMIVQGTHDIQTSLEDSKQLAAGAPSAKVLTIAGMNHVLKSTPADRAAQMPSYSDPDLPVVPQLLDEMAAFIKNVKRSH